MVNVKPGRARNHLVPHKMASYPNEHRLAEAAAKRETWDEAVVKEASEDAAAKVRHVGRRSRLGVNPEPYPRPKPRTRARLPRTDVSAISGRLPRTVEFPKASTPTFPRLDVFSFPPRECSRPRPAPRTPDALMSNYYYGLEFLKASTDVYKTVFPWLSERLDVLPPFRGTGSAVPLLSARYAVTSNFAITYIR